MYVYLWYTDCNIQKSQRKSYDHIQVVHVSLIRWILNNNNNNNGAYIFPWLALFKWLGKLPWPAPEALEKMEARANGILKVTCTAHMRQS